MALRTSLGGVAAEQLHIACLFFERAQGSLNGIIFEPTANIDVESWQRRLFGDRIGFERRDVDPGVAKHGQRFNQCTRLVIDLEDQRGDVRIGIIRIERRFLPAPGSACNYSSDRQCRAPITTPPKT